MVEPDGVTWGSESIPDADTLFLRVQKAKIRGDLILPGFFCAKDGGMSTDWSKYADANFTRGSAGLHPKTGVPRPPENYGVIFMQVGKVRDIEDTLVHHTPTPKNRAHTDVEFQEANEVQVRLQLVRVARWAIRLEAQVV